LGRAYYYLALHYKDGSQSTYNEHKSSWEETWQLYEQAWDEWEDIADEYDFDSIYCKRTGGQPILGLAQDAGKNLSTEDVMENIEDQVSALRGWQLKDEPERRLMSREELRDYNEEHFLEDTTKEEMDDDARTLVALDLIEPGFDLYQMYFDFRTEGILGFYDTDEDVMVDISELDDLDEVGRTTHAHEYQHALQFHNNDMEAIGYSDEGWEEDSERAGAIQAVIEGEARLVERLWKNAYFTIEEHESEIELGEAMDPPPEAPRWYEDDSRFPYRDGYNFVVNVYSVGGWPAVNKLYESPPLSTEMIMHPQKYWEGDNPIAVEPIDLDGALGDGWREFESNVMGEFWTYLILREHIPDYHARFAAAGWGGDSYAVAYNETADQTTLVIHWYWDTSVDAEEFSEAFFEYNQARFGSVDEAYSTVTQICWTGNQVSCMLTNDEQILWVLGPSMGTVSTVTQSLSGYGVLEWAPPTHTATPTPTAADALEPSATPIVNGEWRITGIDVPALASFDNTMQAFMQEQGIGAGALAVTHKGRLIMAHGYTWDADQSYAIQPTSLFRIASLSKSITAATVLKLVQDGHIDLDTRITDILTFDPPAGQAVDPRLNDVTVAHLLYHQSGWDNEQMGYDPMFSDFRISEALGVHLPISQANIMTFMSGMPINQDPGTTFAYSNFGYMLLGRIIEAVSKQPYETYVKQNVLEPLGIEHAQLGQSPLENRLPGEVTYHSDFKGPTVFDATGANVPWPYGGWNLENMDAHGGWIANVVDLARFASSFDYPGSNSVLTQDMITLMFKAPPGTNLQADEVRYYGMGWDVVRWGNNKMNSWHTGSLDGTLTLMVRRWDGVGWIVFFNERENKSDPTGDSYWEIDNLLHNAANAISSWPGGDLFQLLP
jgi:CubicO group peptidase (beta-lactamase class C family)